MFRLNTNEVCGPVAGLGTGQDRSMQESHELRAPAVWGRGQLFVKRRRVNAVAIISAAQLAHVIEHVILDHLDWGTQRQINAADAGIWEAKVPTKGLTHFRPAIYDYSNRMTLPHRVNVRTQRRYVVFTIHYSLFISI